VAVLSAACLGLTVGFANRAGADISEIDMMAQQVARNGGAPGDYTQEISVHGSGIDGISVTPPTGGVAVTMTADPYDANRWSNHNSASYATLAAVLADYPVGDYAFTIHYANGTSDSKTLLFDASDPTGFPQITSPTPNAVNVPYASPGPTFTWTQVPDGSGWGFGCDLNQVNGSQVASAHPLPITSVSWAPGVSLQPQTQYEFALSLAQLGTANMTETTNGGNDFQYFGVVLHTSAVDFTTVVPEPATLWLLIVGGLSWLCCRWRQRKERV
jgi:hypothetical protein